MLLLRRNFASFYGLHLGIDTYDPPLDSIQEMRLSSLMTFLSNKNKSICFNFLANANSVTIIFFSFLNILVSSISEETFIVEMRIWCRKVGSARVYCVDLYLASGLNSNHTTSLIFTLCVFFFQIVDLVFVIWGFLLLAIRYMFISLF